MKSPDLETNQSNSQLGMKSPEIETDPYISMKMKRKSDTGFDDEIVAKTRRMEGAKKAVCSSDSLGSDTVQGDRHTKSIILPSGITSNSTEVTPPHHDSNSLSSSLLSPGLVGEREDVDSLSRLNVARLSTTVAPGLFGGLNDQERLLQRNIEPGDSLARLFKQRFPQTHRDFPLGRSAFREVCKEKPSTPFSPQLLPLRPRLLNEQLYGPTGVRPKVGKPFAGLSDIDVRTNTDGKAGTNTVNKSNIPNQTQPISQPLQESRTRHLTLAQLSANGTSQTWPQTLRLGPYRSLRQNLLEGRVDSHHLNSMKATQFMPFGRYHGNRTE
ncbi:uncharacterized protein LOC121432135 [Lytechinus variegatus]|uniref:uncharacterized protein LOC121432135 n=1 Tax=Lytechinus variegatus TaxID=7654 RepID=UPI001BB23A01|nr:uncharacterized protein LOC121432135 [Lytechinus variegatus]